MSSRKPAKTAAPRSPSRTRPFDLLRAFGIKKVFGNPGSTELPFLERLARRHRLRARPAGGLRRRHGRRLRAGDPQRRLRQPAFGGRRRQCARQYLHRLSQPDAAGDHRRASRRARSCRCRRFSMPSARPEFPQPYVKYSVEPARAEDVPAAIARAYYVAMQPPCGPTFVSVPIDDWTHPTQPVEAAPRQPRARPRSGRDEGAGRRRSPRASARPSSSAPASIARRPSS